jgi:hypothetical protein
MALAVKTLLETLRLRDLRGQRVLPPLLSMVVIHVADPAARKSFAFFLARPARRVTEFFRTLHEHRESSEIALAGFAVLIAFVRASALFLLAFAALVLAVSKF